MNRLANLNQPIISVRGIRGAVVAEENSQEAIYTVTSELFREILRHNPDLKPVEIASIFFTMTPDLDAAYPALAVRQMGWKEVAMLCSQEIPVPDSLARCIRVLIHWNTYHTQEEIRHVYLGEASILRPDFASRISTNAAE